MSINHAESVCVIDHANLLQNFNNCARQTCAITDNRHSLRITSTTTMRVSCLQLTLHHTPLPYFHQIINKTPVLVCLCVVGCCICLQTAQTRTFFASPTLSLPLLCPFIHFLVSSPCKGKFSYRTIESMLVL